MESIVSMVMGMDFVTLMAEMRVGMSLASKEAVNAFLDLAEYVVHGWCFCLCS